MHVTHFGHACLMVRTGDAQLLLDPGVFSTGFEDLTGLDAILITHLHVDHVDAQRLPTLLENNPGAALLTEPGLAIELADSGLDARPLTAGEGAEFRGATVRAVGGRHAVIHADIPRIGNVGLVIGADGEPTLFHPGDCYEAVPSPDEAPAGVDVLAFPLNAPWAALKETVEFIRAVQPRRAVPIHDALLADRGRALYLRVLGDLLPESTTLRDLAGLGPVELTS
jgi:L-ascorbate metabolism protein UlaG (beta-lactamase superfamily)